MKETDRKFRTEDEMISDSMFIINAPIKYGTKFAVLDDICWKWTEFNGKYKGCQYWSKQALKELENLNKNNKKFKYGDYFRHEHIVPRAVFINKIFETTNLNKIILKELFNKFMIGVVVTIKEDKALDSAGYRQKMPKEFNDHNSQEYNNEWLRYKKVKKINIRRGHWLDDKFITEKTICF